VEFEVDLASDEVDAVESEVAEVAIVAAVAVAVAVAVVVVAEFEVSEVYHQVWSPELLLTQK